MAIIVQSREHEEALWEEMMYMLEHNMPWVLKNLEKIHSFKVSWNHYARIFKDCECGCRNKHKSNYCCECGNDISEAKMLHYGVGMPNL